MLFSKPISYSVRALVYLAKNQGNGPILGSQIAENEELPAPFLAKLMGNLVNSGFVVATRGPGGGFTLAVDPETISLYDVYTMYEGFQLAQDCLLGLGKCGDNNACAVHHAWKEPKQKFMEFLRGTTIADLISPKKGKIQPAGRQ